MVKPSTKKPKLLGELLPKLDPHPKQALILTDEHRFQVVAAGRRAGKTHVAIAKGAQVGVRHPRCRIWFVSPNFPQQEEIWSKALDVLDAQHQVFKGKGNYKGNFVKDMRLARGYRKLELFNGSSLEFKSAESKDGLRGAGQNIRFLILDEAAYVDTYAWKVMRFALVDHVAPAFLISTPNAHTTHDDLFYKRWIFGQEKIEKMCQECLGAGCKRCNMVGIYEEHNPDRRNNYKSWRFTSYDNPHVSEQEIQDLIEEENYTEADIQREILAQFIEGEGAVFSLEAINMCMSGVPEGYVKGRFYVAGVDFGKVQDFTSFMIMDPETGHVVRHERFKGPWPYQKDMIKNIYREYGQPYTVVDSTQAGDVVMDDLIQDEGLTNIHGYNFNGPTKMRLYESLKAAIETRSITIPYEYQEIADELAHINGKKLPSSGIMSYGAARGYHDDCAVSLALAWKALTETQGGASSFMSVALIGG